MVPPKRRSHARAAAAARGAMGARGDLPPNDIRGGFISPLPAPSTSSGPTTIPSPPPPPSPSLFPHSERMRASAFFRSTGTISPSGDPNPPTPILVSRLSSSSSVAYKTCGCAANGMGSKRPVLSSRCQPGSGSRGGCGGGGRGGRSCAPARLVLRSRMAIMRSSNLRRLRTIACSSPIVSMIFPGSDAAFD